jgi:hypothetical protein
MVLWKVYPWVASLVAYRASDAMMTIPMIELEGLELEALHRCRTGSHVRRRRDLVVEVEYWGKKRA